MTVEDLVHAHGQALLRLAVMLTGTSTDAEDLFQSTLVRLLRSPRGLSRADRPVAYARRALVNEFISAGRRPWRREHPTADPPEVIAPGSTTAAEDDGWRLLHLLPRQQRAVLALRYYEGLPDTEIADVLGISFSTVRSNAARGLATLRTTLNTPDEELSR